MLIEFYQSLANIIKLIELFNECNDCHLKY